MASGRLTKLYSGKPEPDLQALVHLDVPQAAAVPGVKLPAGLVIPPGRVDARHALAPGIAFDSLRRQDRPAQLEARARWPTCSAPGPNPRIQGQVHLDLPAARPPAASAEAARRASPCPRPRWTRSSPCRAGTPPSTPCASDRGRLAGGLRAVRDLMGKPQPGELKAKAHLELPRTKAASVPFVKLPAGRGDPGLRVDADCSAGLGREHHEPALESPRALPWRFRARRDLRASPRSRT